MSVGDEGGLVVSTECPRCGAPLDFSEGTNAVHCGHCGSALLVTGRKRVLRYWTRPRVDATQAAQSLKTAGATARGAPVLHFVPYYRLTGHEFRWERPLAPAEHAERAALIESLADNRWYGSNRGDALLDTLTWAAESVLDLLGAPSSGSARAPATPTAQIAPTSSVPAGAMRAKVRAQDLVFRDRYIDRSFLAADAHDLGVESLGIRASVLRVELYRRETVAALGRVGPVDVPVDSALALGMQAIDPVPIVHRTVIGRVLSIVYFPFWLVPTAAGRIAVVDAITGTIARADAPPSLPARLDRAGDGEAETVGFRPLVCPNCGGDLPLRPDDVIFACAACERAWALHGAEFFSVPVEVADVPATGRAGDVKYLPCWVLDGTDTGARPLRLLVPAFRFRRLKLLADLARSLSHAAPTWTTVRGDPPAPLLGCHYDAEDAMLLARFTSAPAGDEAVRLTGASLVWLPFRRELAAWRDPFTGLALPENGLVC